ncbi:MAG: hypothetical protein JSS32_04455 [Verrucomicrobia bacterium]|nr:hypothetical protein [Verrucomicrobiota bacterium]
MLAQSVTCSSCRGNFAVREEFVTLKPCKHIFHQACSQNGPDCQTCATPINSREVTVFDKDIERIKKHRRDNQVNTYNTKVRQEATLPQSFGDVFWCVGTQMFANFAIPLEEEQAVEHDANAAFLNQHVEKLRQESGKDRYLYIHEMPEAERLLRLLEDPKFSTDETRQILSDYNRWKTWCNVGVVASVVSCLAYLYFRLPQRA